MIAAHVAVDGKTVAAVRLSLDEDEAERKRTRSDVEDDVPEFMVEDEETDEMPDEIEETLEADQTEEPITVRRSAGRSEGSHLRAPEVTRRVARAGAPGDDRGLRPMDSRAELRGVLRRSPTGGRSCQAGWPLLEVQGRGMPVVHGSRLDLANARPGRTPIREG
jgi:DNA polymerase II large subunit